MKIRTVLIILGFTSIIVSCIPSLYPLYRDKDLLIDNKLEGLYETGENEYWKIRRLDPDFEKLSGDWKQYNSGYTYKLSVREEDKLEEFALHLLELGDDLYLDFFPVNYDIRHGFLDMHLVPSHIFAKAELTDQALIIQFFDLEWLEDLIDSKKIKISYVETRYSYLLTAKTEELQKFITKFANDSTTFIDADTLIRQDLSASVGDLSMMFNIK
ncbi:MAG: hypothetical protein KAT31_17015 [Bacteroidales bacterium]|nr:hypothetical protein [Bacteroidales bacterium]